MALAMRSPVISSLPNAVLKYGLYAATFEIFAERMRHVCHAHFDRIADRPKRLIFQRPRATIPEEVREQCVRLIDQRRRLSLSLLNTDAR